MVEGADECCDAMPILGPPTAMVGAGVTVAAEVPLTDAVPAFTAGEVATLVGCAMGSKGGCSIIVPAAGSMRFTI